MRGAWCMVHGVFFFVFFPFKFFNTSWPRVRVNIYMQHEIVRVHGPCFISAFAALTRIIL